MENYLAKTSILVQVKLQARQNYCTEFRSNCVNADVFQIKTMAETTRQAEMLQKITQQHFKCYTGSNYKYDRTATQNSLVTPYMLMQLKLQAQEKC